MMLMLVKIFEYISWKFHDTETFWSFVNTVAITILVKFVTNLKMCILDCCMQNSMQLFSKVFEHTHIHTHHERSIKRFEVSLTSSWLYCESLEAIWKCGYQIAAYIAAGECIRTFTTISKNYNIVILCRFVENQLLS